MLQYSERDIALRNSINVSEIFKVIIDFSAYLFLAGVFQHICEYLFYKTQKLAFHLIMNICKLIQYCHILMVFLIHLYRLRHSSKVCVGDYLASDFIIADKDVYLEQRGELIYGLMVGYWIAIVLWVIC